MAFGVTRDPLSGAIRANQAATGAKRYGANASTTATTGPVDKAGYAQRERDKGWRRRLIQQRMAASGANPYSGR